MGGNATIRGREAQRLDLKVTERNYMVPRLNALLHSINTAYQKATKQTLWDPKLLQSGHFLSGSSLHFFNTKGISDETFVQKKPKVGDIDTMVDRTKEESLQQFLTAYTDKQIGSAIFRGFDRGNEQYISLWELQDPPATIQIDFEFVDYQDGEPTDWAKFSHSSSWEDLQHGVKGVFHKLLIQSLAALSKQTFLQRKMVGRGKMRTEQDVPVTDNMYTFAVSSKEGGGLRAKYEPVIGVNGRPETKDGLPVMSATPTTGYIKDIGQIFSTLLGKRLPAQASKQLTANFWSFTGIISVLAKILTPEERAAVVDSFIVRTIGPGAQGLYKNNPVQDLQEKLIALKYIMQKLGVSKPKEFDQLLQNYRSSYKMTTESTQLTEAPDYKRKSIPHIYNPGSTVEIKNKDFIELCKEIAENGGTLDDATVNLKIDGAGIRFGRDRSGKPFFMTSRVTEPKYLENFGDFENFNRENGQSEERIAFAKNYDNALKIILTSPLMKAIPADTVVQAEMLFNAMAKRTKDGYKFVNINYDPSKLGEVMTLSPFNVREYSTGKPSPHGAEVLRTLLKLGDDNIKVINNTLPQRGIDVSKIINPIVANADGLAAALAKRGTTEQKTKALEVLAHAKQRLSEAIINSPIAGKDQLGDSMEGLVINLPSGRSVKVTSRVMKDAMAAKRVAPAGPRSGKTAVVTAGSFAGHHGHEQLIKLVLEKAAALGADPYVYISPTVGAEDPIPPQMKLLTLQKLFPNHANIFQIWQEGGTPVKKIEKELVTRTNPPPYDKIIVMVGDDRYEGFKKWMEHLSKRMKNPQYPGFDHVQFHVENTPRGAESGGTGVTFTDCRNILLDPSMSEEENLAYWCRAFDVEKLGAGWIKQLMDAAKKGMGIQQMTKKEKIKEFIQRARPMLKEASIEKKMEVLQFLKESIQEVEESKYVEMDPTQFNDDDFYAYDPETKVIKSKWGYKSIGRMHNEQQAKQNGLEIARGMSAKRLGLLVKKQAEDVEEAANPAQQAAIAVNMKKHHQKPKNVSESKVIEITDYDTWSDEVKKLGGEIHAQKDRNVLVAQSWDGEELGKFHLGKSMGFINQSSELDEHIGKVKGGYRLYSHKGKNLGTFPSKAGAEKHEREVQYFKHMSEDEDQFDLENRHTMDYGKRKYMIHKLSRATDYERNALELASDDELREFFHQTFPNVNLDEDYLDE